jgi:hypothetical protein
MRRVTLEFGALPAAFSAVGRAVSDRVGTATIVA